MSETLAAIPQMVVDERLESLGTRITDTFTNTDKPERMLIELEWIEDLRAYGGGYGPEVKFVSPNASRAFVRLTQVKVKALDARIGELVFPAAVDGWSLHSSPIVTLAPDREDFLRQQIAQMSTAEGQPMEPAEVPPEMLEALERVLSDKAAERMTLKIRDVLVEARWRHVAQQVYHSGHLYGTGILKGPLVESRAEKRWQRVGGGRFAITERQLITPFVEATRVWDYYPESTAQSLWDTDRQTQRHLMSRDALLRLAQRKDFRGPAILEHLRNYPEGDATWEWWEQEIFRIGRNDPASLAPRPFRRYEVLETWQSIDALDLRREGVELPEELSGIALEAYCWVFAKTGRIIKLALNPMSRRDRPQSFYIPEPEEGRLFGASVPSQMRDGQQLANAAIRMMVDNAAWAVRPNVVLAKRRIRDNPDPLNLYPGRVWLTEEGNLGDNRAPIETIDMPLHAPTYMQMFSTFKMLVDEATAIPSFQHGERSPGVGRTVGGLSLLMGAANLMLREPLRRWDECFESFLRKMYDWFMQFDKDESAKGDFNIEVRGTYSIMAKEFRSEKLEAFATNTANPLDAPLVNRDVLLRERASTLDIPPGIIKSPEQLQAEQRDMMAAGEVNGGSSPEGSGEGGSGDAVNAGQVGGQGAGAVGGESGEAAGAGGEAAPGSE